MYKCLSLDAIDVKQPWEDCLALARDNGFEGMDLPSNADQPAAWYRDLLQQHGLRAGGVELTLDFHGDEATFEREVTGLDAIAQRAAGVGVTRFFCWIRPFSDTLPYQEHFRLFARRLGLCAEILSTHNCRLGLEFIGPRHLREGPRYPFIYTMRGMLDLAEAVGSGTGLLVDSYHWYTSMGTKEDILNLDPAQVVYVHINDAPTVPVEKQEDLVRCLPGETGVIDITTFLNCLRTIGYDGPVVTEPFVQALSELSAEDAITKVSRAMQTVWVA